MTTILAAIFLLVIVASFAFKWGYSDGEEKGYEEGLDDGAQLFRGSLARLNQRISDLEKENEELKSSGSGMEQHNDNA